MEHLSSMDKIIHDQFSRYGKNAKEWMNKCVFLLPKIEKNRIWEKKKFSSIYEYAAKIAGMSRNKVNEGLRILKKTENLPAIRKVIEEKGIFAVRPVVNIATSETDQLWAKKALEMTKSTLETFVRDFRKEQEQKAQESADVKPLEYFYNHETVGHPGVGSPMNNALNEPNDSRIQVSMKLSPEIVNALKKIKGKDDWNRVMEKLLGYSQKELKAEQKRIGEKEKRFQEELQKEKPKAVRTGNHTVTTSIKNYIKKRSRGKCEYPNCNRPGKHIHHIEPFALKREHNPDKLIYLCEEHHQIVHLGYIDDNWNQCEQLPIYDMKNVINNRVTEFKEHHY